MQVLLPTMIIALLALVSMTFILFLLLRKPTLPLSFDLTKEMITISHSLPCYESMVCTDSVHSLLNRLMPIKLRMQDICDLYGDNTDTWFDLMWNSRNFSKMSMIKSASSWFTHELPTLLSFPFAKSMNAIGLFLLTMC